MSTLAEKNLSREIKRRCDLHATALAAGSRYGVQDETTQKRVTSMRAYVVNEGRLFALKPSDWSMLLGGVALCGLLTLLF
jgi:hypothetical protein